MFLLKNIKQIHKIQKLDFFVSLFITFFLKSTSLGNKWEEKISFYMKILEKIPSQLLTKDAV